MIAQKTELKPPSIKMDNKLLSMIFKNQSNIDTIFKIGGDSWQIYIKLF